MEVTDKFVNFGSTVDSTLHWLPQYWYSSTTRPFVFSDGSVRPSLVPESAESRHQAENLHYVCPGLYGAETWTLLKEDSRRLQAFHTTRQRRIIDIRWNDFITNRAVADTTNLPSILSTIATRRHSIFGHIRRQSDSTPAHKALKLVVNARSGDTPHHGWNRPPGRPRISWISQFVRTPDSLLLTRGLSPTTGQHGGRYDPRPGYAQQWVSEWVSQCLVHQNCIKLLQMFTIPTRHCELKQMQTF